MKKFGIFYVMALIGVVLTGCDGNYTPSADEIQKQQQTLITADGARSVGMPAIKNHREQRILKDILELRDQTGLVTYTYQWSEVTGKRVFLCNSIGYPISAATQFTNPMTISESRSQTGYAILPQADPNGLFSPATAEGTWIMCSGPNGEARPVYSEPRVITSQFKLSE
jgi:hypothetical protein